MLSQPVAADNDAADGQEGLTDVFTLLVTNPMSSLLEEPSKAPFDDAAVLCQTAPVAGIPSCDPENDPLWPEGACESNPHHQRLGSHATRLAFCAVHRPGALLMDSHPLVESPVGSHGHCFQSESTQAGSPCHC